MKRVIVRLVVGAGLLVALGAGGVRQVRMAEELAALRKENGSLRESLTGRPASAEGGGMERRMAASRGRDREADGLAESGGERDDVDGRELGGLHKALRESQAEEQALRQEILKLSQAHQRLQEARREEGARELLMEASWTMGGIDAPETGKGPRWGRSNWWARQTPWRPRICQRHGRRGNRIAERSGSRWIRRRRRTWRKCGSMSHFVVLGSPSPGVRWG